MNKKLFYIITACAVIITGIFVYHYMFYVPQKDTLTLSRDCALKSSNRHDMEVEQMLTGNDSSSISDLNFVFDSKTKKCLYHTKVENVSGTHQSIIDLFTNETIAFYTQSGDKKYGDESKFNIEFSKYFGTK